MVWNWREVERSVDIARPLIEGQKVERVFVPKRPAASEGFLKNEWALLLSGEKGKTSLLISLSPQHLGWAASPGLSLSSSVDATQNTFGLTLKSKLTGLRILQIETVPHERAFKIDFGKANHAQFCLVVGLIPNRPEAVLLHPESEKLIASSRPGTSTLLNALGKTGRDKRPTEPTVRSEVFASPSILFKWLNETIESDLLDARRSLMLQKIRRERLAAQKSLRQATAVLEKREKPWGRYGDLLKSVLGTSPAFQNGVISILNHETGEAVDVPYDPKLSLQQTMKNYYLKDRQSKRKTQDATERAEELSQAVDSLARLEKSITDAKGFESLVALSTGKTSKQTPVDSRSQGWKGKVFHSMDGQAIWVGRKKEENQELTFHIARGNDLWMHVRGRPGCHVVIPLDRGKSASLETLLDAATLAIHYSGGAKWGKTEVDYTYRKYVKRIPKSVEVRYTHNKTLLVKPDEERIKRLKA